MDTTQHLGLDQIIDSVRASEVPPGHPDDHDMLMRLVREVERLRAEVARKDEVWREVQSERVEFLDRFSEAKAREEARLLAEQAESIVLKPGEYALISFPGVAAEAMDELRNAVPEDLQGRLLFVNGEVHTLKPA